MTSRFQFSVVHLLFLTTAVAAALGVVRWLDLPDVLFRYLLGGYAVFFGLWLAIRGPAVIAGLNEVARRRRDVIRRRDALASEIEARRRELKTRRTGPQDADASTDRV